MALSNTIAVSEERVMRYTVREGSVMHTYSPEKDKIFLKTLDRISKYAEMCDYKLNDNYFFNVSLFNSSNSFGIFKYILVTSYKKEIGLYLKDMIDNPNYRKLLKFFLFKHPKFNKTTLNSALLFFVPIRLSYSLFRIKMKLVSVFTTDASVD